MSNKAIFGMTDQAYMHTGKGLSGVIGLSGNVNWVRRNAAGEITGEWDIPNLITNAGKAKVADLLVSDIGSAAPTQWEYIAIGTSSTAADPTDTALIAEISTNGGARTTVTGTRTTTTVTNDTAQFVATFTFTGAFAITESGVFDDISTGTMLCRQVFAAINVASGDSLTITWKVAVS